MDATSIVSKKNHWDDGSAKKIWYINILFYDFAIYPHTYAILVLA